MQYVYKMVAVTLFPSVEYALYCREQRDPSGRTTRLVMQCRSQKCNVHAIYIFVTYFYSMILNIDMIPNIADNGQIRSQRMALFTNIRHSPMPHQNTPTRPSFIKAYIALNPFMFNMFCKENSTYCLGIADSSHGKEYLM